MSICDQFNLDSNIIIRWSELPLSTRDELIFGKNQGVANALGLLYAM